jgi:hypothetical protein
VISAASLSRGLLAVLALGSREHQRQLTQELLTHTRTAAQEPRKCAYLETVSASKVRIRLALPRASGQLPRVPQECAGIMLLLL